MLTTVQDNLTREEAVARAAIISGCVYDIALDVTGGDEVFESTTTVRFDCSEPGASTFIDLTAPSVESIELNGQQVPLEAFEGHRIRLDDLQASNTLRVTATCSYRHTGTGLHHFRDPVDKEVYLHTQFEPFDAHAVYACFDQPDIKGTFAFTVTAPEGWEVVSNMAPTSAPGSGGGRWAFPPTPVMSTYITAIVAGPFHVVRDRHRNIDLGLFCRKSLAQYLDPEEIFEVTKQGFDWFEKAFDYPYPFGKYDQLFVPEFKFGAMENAGCVTFVEAYVFRSRVTDAARESRASTILHEMAHMWFGDLVTMRWWDDLWLNESFATFMGNLCMSRATRFTNVWATFASGTKTGAYRQDQLPSTHPIVADIPDIHATHLNFDAITYNKGASVLKQLVAWAGEGAFLDGLKEYFRRHEWGNTDLSDFLAPIAAKSGRDLQAWSAEWLETAGVNTLRLSIETEGSVLRSVQVLQEAPESHPHLRPHRMAIGLYDASDDGLVLRRRVELDVDGDRTAVPELDGEKVPDLLLPNDDDLTYAKIRLDDKSLQTLISRLRDLRDPVARALSWSAAWDMTRDAEMRTRDFVELVVNNIDSESDIVIVQAQVGRALQAAHHYSDPANRLPALSRICRQASEAMRSSEPGSDFQLAWAQFFALAAEDPEDLRLVQALLDGTESMDGLKVDTDLRWTLVRAIARRPGANASIIDAELELDPTDAGHRHAAAARASMATAEAKAEAWDRISGDPELSLATMRSLMGGFRQSDQQDLLRPYASRYLDRLQGFWSERGIDYGLSFAAGLYPGYLAEQETLDMTDAYLARDDVPAPIRRILTEGADDVRRAMRARAKDATG